MADVRPPEETHRPSLGELFRYFIGLGSLGFGGPIALVGAMERQFVDQRRWATRQELRDGLAFSQLAPGPLAAQLAIYLGWLVAGPRGATVAGVAFITPSFLMVIALAAFYVRYGGVSWLQGAFYGVGAAVIALIARSAARLARTTLEGDRFLWLIFGVNAVATAWTESELVVVLVCSGLAVAALRRPGSSEARRGFADLSLVLTILLFFTSAGLVVFGSGLAIVPFLHAGVVLQHGWLTEREFLDAVAVALVTPGPVVITVAFIGYLVAGLAGAFAAAAGVFAPVYLLTLLLAPRFERLKSNQRVRAFIDGVTAAATGAIAGAVFVLGRRAITDVPTAVIAALTLAAVVYKPRLRDPPIILAAGVTGVLWKSI